MWSTSFPLCRRSARSALCPCSTGTFRVLAAPWSIPWSLGAAGGVVRRLLEPFSSGVSEGVSHARGIFPDHGGPGGGVRGRARTAGRGRRRPGAAGAPAPRVPVCRKTAWGRRRLRKTFTLKIETACAVCYNPVRRSAVTAQRVGSACALLCLSCAVSCGPVGGRVSARPDGLGGMRPVLGGVVYGPVRSAVGVCWRVRAWQVGSGAGGSGGGRVVGAGRDVGAGRWRRARRP